MPTLIPKLSQRCLRLALVACVAAMLGCGQSGTLAPSSNQVQALIDGNNAFALDLYRQTGKRPGNLFFSPYSISTGLGITYAGARGQTQIDIARAAHFNLPPEELHAAFRSLARSLNKAQRWNRITLSSSPSLWCQKDYCFSDSFAALVRSQYNGDARSVDFKSADASAETEIANWMARQTRGRIKTSGVGQFASDTRLVLCSSIYFKGKWASQFDSKQTSEAPFFITPEHTAAVRMMRQKSRFKMCQTDGVSLLELPYAAGTFSMVVLLPVARDGLPSLENRLTPKTLSMLLGRLAQAAPREILVWLPRFKTVQSLDLKPALISLGVPSLFSEAADLSGMTGARALYLSEATHQAFAQIDESGTETAATTLLRAKTKSMSDAFMADHPFTFLIRENGTGCILFLGRLVDPTTSEQ